jgi:protein kinase A/protein kinase X
LKCYPGKYKSIYFIRYPPFYDNEPLGIYKKVIDGIIEFPVQFDVKVKDLIRKLLNPDLNYRLGV